MIKQFALLALSYLALGSAASCNSTKYLQVTLWDSFGDGWQNAWWMMSDPGNEISKEQSDCWNIEKVFDVHPCDHTPSGGIYYMIVQTPDESLPEGWWEIYWKVEVMYKNGTATGEWYEGWYNSTMVWNYDHTSDTWTLIHRDNIPDFDCVDCSGSACPPKKPKPEPKKRDKKDKGPIKGRGGPGSKGSNGDDGDSTGNSTSTSNNSTDSSSTGNSTNAFKYGPRAVDLTVQMFSEECNGWGDITGYPLTAHWYIADYTKTKIFDQGSLCAADACEGSCNICLGDGSYVFRVTGPTFNETLEEIYFRREGVDPEDENIDHSIIDKYYYNSWEFCHARGHYNDQLNFHVVKGKCIPDDLRWADEICDAMENSTVTVVGMIALGGMHSEFFNSRDSQMVMSHLATVVEGWSASRMAVVSTALDTQQALSSVPTFTHDIEFSVTFVAEDYGIDGATYAAVSNLVNDMAATIEASFSSGVFAAQLSGDVQLSGSVLSTVDSAELLSLEITQISYTHTRLVYYYGEDSTVSNQSVESSISSGMIVLFIAVGAIAFIAFVGVAAHGFNGYNKLSTVTDSEHVAVELVSSPFTKTPIYPKGNASPLKI